MATEKKPLQLEQRNAGPSISLSNIYARCIKEKMERCRRAVKIVRVRNLSKSPGCSWLEVEKKVHMFTGGDDVVHPKHKLIVEKLEKLGSMLREAGYSPDSSFVMHDVDEEQKIYNLGYHSEKIPVAYGLLKVPEGTSIRVMKNLMVYGDCHSAIKLIAKLRDANRFHQFKDDVCSCGDYW